MTRPLLCTVLGLLCWAVSARAQDSEAPANAAPDADQAAVEAELIIAQEVAAEPAVDGDDTLRIFGFTDFGLDKWFVDNDGAGLLRPTAASTFVFGNLNLYFEATPVDRLRTMIEVRLTLAPHGEERELGPPIGTSYERIDTTAFDFASPSSQSHMRLGGLFIERAWTEYEFLPWFKVRWGLFLTPFGIWNLDHGSPTLISLMLPTFISAQMIPTRLLGVHVFGSWFLGSSELGYALHVSNGRTPLDFDLTEDKGLGARLYWANESDYGRLVLGASGYIGTYVDAQKIIHPVNAQAMASENIYSTERTVDYSEQVLGFDGSLDVGRLRVRSEAVLRWVKYTRDLSEQIATGNGTVQFLPNRLEWSAYALIAYRTPWRVEPYISAELATKSYLLPLWAHPASMSSSNFATVFLSVGFNVQLTSYTLFKAQAVWFRNYDGDFTNKAIDFPAVFVRIVDSF